MNTRTISRSAAPALALALAIFAAACSSDDSSTGTNTSGQSIGTNADPTTPDAGTASTTNATPANNTTTDQEQEDLATMENTEIRINGATRGTPIYNERYTASKDIRGYRSQLMAELEAIRTRLNDGTRAPEATKKDQDRAADLAQGLERMDRLIKAVEESDDLTWTSIRESQLKEAGEVRVWATEHGYKVS